MSSNLRKINNSDVELHKALINARKWLIYCASLLLSVFGTAVTGISIYVMYQYIEILVNNPAKLEAAITYSLSFVFGGGILSPLVAKAKKIGK